MDLLVVGAGEMGVWLAETLLPAVDTVAFADRDGEAAERAAEELAAAESNDADAVETRVVTLETSEAFDVVALAVPIPAVAGAVRQHAPNATGALIDVSGVMETPLAAMDRHAVSEYASFHPLFAAERAPGRIAFVPGETGATVQRIRSALADAGNEVFETTAAEHDAAMESVQAGAHAAVLAYATATEDVDDRFQTPISQALTELVQTVTAGDPRVYADIQSAFDGAGAVADAAAEIAAAVEREQPDGDPFRELFLDARERVARVEPDSQAADPAVNETETNTETTNDDEPDGDPR
jgi:prephenate dehydrogenase